jgi:hypothetical protein
MKAKFLYVMRDPFKKGGVKIGITSFRSAKVRLGTYQNSFPGKSHLATFNKLWYGKPNAVNEIEKVLKNQFGYAIELDGRGFTEWVYEDETVIVNRIETLIKGYGFHVFPVDTDGENVYTIDELIGNIEAQHDDKNTSRSKHP